MRLGSGADDRMGATAGFTRREALVLMAGAAAAAALGLSGCGEAPYKSPYDWNALERTGEHLAYAPEGEVLSRWGVDVSSHQHDIDWSAAADAGVQFAFVRAGNRGATEGALYEDEFFMANVAGAVAAGIPLSTYFFSQAISLEEAEEEVEFLLGLLAKAEAAGATFEAVAFDHEAVNVEGARANDLDGELLSDIAVKFCDRLEAAGYAPLVYGNQRDLKRLDKVVRQAYPLWLAEYDTEIPTAQFDFRIWQYTNTGQIPGIPTEVDLNIWLPAPDAGK